MNDQSDIGEQFQKARNKRGLSLQDAAHQTRIPLATLQALEADDYSSFTSSAYAKSFLSQYSDFLRIDADEIVENFNTGNIVTEPDHIKFLNQNKSATTQRAASSSDPSPSAPNSGSSISQPLLILLITGGLLAAGIWGFITVEKRLNTTAETKAPESAPPSIPADSVAKAPDATTSVPASIPTNPFPPKPKEGARAPRIISSIATLPTPDPDAPVYVFPEHKAAPRAIIVNEDDDQ